MAGRPTLDLPSDARVPHPSHRRVAIMVRPQDECSPCEIDLAGIGFAPWRAPLTLRANPFSQEKISSVSAAVGRRFEGGYGGCSFWLSGLAPIRPSQTRWTRGSGLRHS